MELVAIGLARSEVIRPESTLACLVWLASIVLIFVTPGSSGLTSPVRNSAPLT